MPHEVTLAAMKMRWDSIAVRVRALKLNNAEVYARIERQLRDSLFYAKVL